GQRLTREGVPASLDRVEVTTLIKDRDANLWVGTPTGLLRLNRRGVASLDPPSPTRAVRALFEDRDSNLWIGTASRLAPRRDGALTAYPETRTVTNGDVGPLFVDDTDRVWFAPSSGGLYWMRDGHVARVDQAGLSSDVIYSLDGTGNELWIGRQRGGLTRLR